MKRPWALLIAIALAGTLAAGCASTTALRNAKEAFAQAKAAGAETKAPFEYYAAEAYLDLADHERVEGDRGGIVEFANKSQKYSAEALQKAGGGAK